MASVELELGVAGPLELVEVLVPGEEPGAVVHLKPGMHASEEELRAFVAGKLAAFKVPIKVAFWPETLPRNPNGKILKTELKKVFAA